MRVSDTFWHLTLTSYRYRIRLMSKYFWPTKFFLRFPLYYLPLRRRNIMMLIIFYFIYHVKEKRPGFRFIAHTKFVQLALLKKYRKNTSSVILQGCLFWNVLSINTGLPLFYINPLWIGNWDFLQTLFFLFFWISI